jgi:phosphate transport system substrate-binding protein
VRAVLDGSRKMNWERLQEFRDVKNPDGTIHRAAQQSIDALRADRFGMAVSSLEFAGPEVKALALAKAEGEISYRATRATVIERTYPLTRRTFAFVDVPPDKTMEPRVKEFLRYALSREGQADVARDDGYLPLSEAVRDAQVEMLR